MKLSFLSLFVSCMTSASSVDDLRNLVITPNFVKIGGDFEMKCAVNFSLVEQVDVSKDGGLEKKIVHVSKYQNDTIKPPELEDILTDRGDVEVEALDNAITITYKMATCKDTGEFGCHGEYTTPHKRQRKSETGRQISSFSATKSLIVTDYDGTSPTVMFHGPAGKLENCADDGSTCQKCHLPNHMFADSFAKNGTIDITCEARVATAKGTHINFTIYEDGSGGWNKLDDVSKTLNVTAANHCAKSQMIKYTVSYSASGKKDIRIRCRIDFRDDGDTKVTKEATTVLCPMVTTDGSGGGGSNDATSKTTATTGGSNETTTAGAVTALSHFGRAMLAYSTALVVFLV